MYCAAGHATFGGATAEIFKLWNGGDDTMEWTFTFEAGTSVTEPRIVQGQPGYIAGVTDVPNSGPETVGYAPAQVCCCYSAMQQPSAHSLFLVALCRISSFAGARSAKPPRCVAAHAFWAAFTLRPTTWRAFVWAARLRGAPGASCTVPSTATPAVRRS